MEELEELRDLIIKNTKETSKKTKLSTQLPLEPIITSIRQSSVLSPTEQKVYLQLAIEFEIIMSKSNSFQEGLYRWDLILEDRLNNYGLNRESWGKIAMKGDLDELLQDELQQLLQKVNKILMIPERKIPITS